jgi:chromosome segregation ATPase
MPVLTFPLAIALVACFVGGSILTWLLQERRHRREQRTFEQHMTRALQARYEVYEGLEQSVVKLLGRFDAMEGEFKVRLAEARDPRVALAKTVRLRSANPELWDLEREHQHVQSQQLGEIARQAARISELMEALQQLEPGKSKVEEELAHTRSRYETAVANARDAEQAAQARIARLESRLRELEPIAPAYETARRELDGLKQGWAQREQAHRTEVQALAAQLQALQSTAQRAAQLEHFVKQRQGEFRELEERALSLDRELGEVRKLAEASASRCAALEGEREQARKALEQLQAKLELTRRSQGELQAEYDRCRGALADQERRDKELQAELAAASKVGAELRTQLDGTRAQLSERDQRLAALEGQLARSQAEHKKQLTKSADELIDARNAMQMARSDGEKLQLELAEARTRHAALQSHSQAERARLERELAGAQGEHEQRYARLQEDLNAARTALAAANSSLEGVKTQLGAAQQQHATLEREWQQERLKLDSAFKTAQAENALFRARLSAHSSHVEQAWSVLTELKPMLETLEQKLKVSEDPPAALPAQPQAAQAFDLSVLDDPKS